MKYIKRMLARTGFIKFKQVGQSDKDKLTSNELIFVIKVFPDSHQRKLPSNKQLPLISSALPYAASIPSKKRLKITRGSGTYNTIYIIIVVIYC